MTDLQFYLAIILAFAVLPLLFFGGVRTAIAAVVRAPQIAERLGMEISPTAARLAIALLIAVPLAFVSPSMAMFLAGLATLALPVVILGRLVLGILYGALSREHDFWTAFWRFGDPVPLLCALLVVALIPIAIVKLRDPWDTQLHRINPPGQPQRL